MPMERALLLAQLEAMAPLRLAEAWDNVGLLLDPMSQTTLSHAFLTIDLTAATFEEARSVNADVIVAYHPPIFSGLKRLRADHPAEALVLAAARSGTMVYSPHTALDAASGGMAEWLASSLGPGEARPILPHAELPQCGGGRIVELAQPLALGEAVTRIKQYLELKHVRLATPSTSEAAMVRRFAVCPGAGGSLFERVGTVDLLLTGEMRHHDVLARQAAGTAVILTDHTNTERGYLPVLGRLLRARCPDLRVTVSRIDADPLQVV